MNRGHIPPEFGQVGTPMTLSPPKCDDDLESAFPYAVLTDFSTAAKKTIRETNAKILNSNAPKLAVGLRPLEEFERSPKALSSRGPALQL